MWPGSPPAIMRGTKALMPWMIPQTLTPRTHSQSAMVRSHEHAGLKDAGVVAEQVHGAEAS